MSLALTEPQRASAIQSIQGFFLGERDEEVGLIAAGAVLDFVLADLAPAFYNQGVADARRRIEDIRQRLDEELDLLEQADPLQRH